MQIPDKDTGLSKSAAKDASGDNKGGGLPTAFSTPEWWKNLSDSQKRKIVRAIVAAGVGAGVGSYVGGKEHRALGGVAGGLLAGGLTYGLSNAGDIIRALNAKPDSGYKPDSIVGTGAKMLRQEVHELSNPVPEHWFSGIGLGRLGGTAAGLGALAFTPTMLRNFGHARLGIPTNKALLDSLQDARKNIKFDANGNLKPNLTAAEQQMVNHIERNIHRVKMLNREIPASELEFFRRDPNTGKIQWRKMPNIGAFKNRARMQASLHNFVYKNNHALDMEFPGFFQNRVMLAGPKARIAVRGGAAGLATLAGAALVHSLIISKILDNRARINGHKAYEQSKKDHPTLASILGLI